MSYYRRFILSSRLSLHTQTSPKDFTIETDASIKGLGAVLSQMQDDGRLHPITYASRALSRAEENYSITELETLAIVWATSHFNHLIYGHRVTVVTNHVAVKAVLAMPNPSVKHARWWNKVYGCGATSIDIVYRPRKENSNADALSRMPHLPTPQEGTCEGEVQVSVVRSDNISELLSARPANRTPGEFGKEQRKDPNLLPLMLYLEEGRVPPEETMARKVLAQAPQFTVVNGTLYIMDSRQKDRLRVAIPDHL